MASTTQKRKRKEPEKTLEWRCREGKWDVFQRTAKLKLLTDEEQKLLLEETAAAYTDACNEVANWIFENRTSSKIRVHRATYKLIREKYQLGSQMAESAIRKAIKNYQTLLGKKVKWIPIYFYRMGFDVVAGRSYAMKDDIISINTISGRIRMSYVKKGHEKYFDDTWAFGDSRIAEQDGEWYIYLSCKKEEPNETVPKVFVGIDVGINFIATVYDSLGHTRFFSGKEIKNQRAENQALKKKLIEKGTPGALARLDELDEKERRRISDINHRITKEIVDAYSEPVLFVLEDLKGRKKKERVAIKGRYADISWAFADFRQKLEYKAKEKGHEVIYVDPTWTSITCPKCGYTDPANRDKKNHKFECQACFYESNDDRIAAMNLCHEGEVASGQDLDAGADINQPMTREDEAVKVAPMPPKMAPMPPPVS